MVKTQHRFQFNEVKDAGLIAYCSCGYRTAHKNNYVVYGLSFRHLDNQE